MSKLLKLNIKTLGRYFYYLRKTTDVIQQIFVCSKLAVLNTNTTVLNILFKVSIVSSVDVVLVSLTLITFGTVQN